jgi:hypothetical protein
MMKELTDQAKYIKVMNKKLSNVINILKLEY